MMPKMLLTFFKKLPDLAIKKVSDLHGKKSGSNRMAGDRVTRMVSLPKIAVTILAF